ncbi:PAS domain S-box-containing protein/diguanylate cyclase (GGDEF) domain-containing protein [Halomonas shengliensis]|uniref:PAS domain S-box-containing protein/diguanylate cyclase (GGDEF) domain-containing protein n=1 Tax=Halomonas shengliensis TaxID=419597 RepID=A0A1H0N4V1_9GAMM|nr:EAL domain-containing protein [Halomonas shengliensis]SDO87525.1 PAS domain S-box-containing protein/diguanylate cyclase (GGDEF) domain-containing protein [Halomonas shengliensis]
MQARVTAEAAFRLLADGMSRATGETFFVTLVAKLAEILDVDHVLVARVGDDHRAHTLAVWSRGEPAPNLSYDLAGTPCETVAGREVCLYPAGVQRRFPDDELLQRLGAEGYLGLPLNALDGRPLGLLAVLNNRPMQPAGLESEILHIAAAQASAQIERSQANRALQRSEAVARESERRLETLLNHLPGMAYRCLNDTDWTMLVVSQGAEALTGYRPEALLHNREVSYAALIHPLDRARVEAAVEEGIAARSPFRVVYRLRTADGQWRWMLEQGQALYDTEGEVKVLEGFISDITEQHEAQRVQDAVARVAAAITTRIGDGYFHQLVRHLVEILEADAGFIATFTQQGAAWQEEASVAPCHLTTVSAVGDGEGLEEHAFNLSTSPFAALMTTPECAEQVDSPLRWPGLATPQAAWIGRRLDNTQGEPVGIIVVLYRAPPETNGFASAVLRILSSGAAAEVERRQDHRRMRQLAYFDGTTGLANRVRFMEDLAAMRDAAERDLKPLGLLLLDIRRFKEINDLHGHQLGDSLLATLARRLQRSVAPGEALARLSGDEFALLVPEATPERIEQCVARMREVIARPIHLEHHAFSLRVSIGLAGYPRDARTPGELFKAASIALYHAKREDDGVCAFSVSMHRALERRQQMTERLGEAIREDRLALHYQPQIDLRTGRLTGAEALCRWQDATWGWVSPGEFIPMAEERGLIRALGDRVLEQATRQLLGWGEQELTLPGRLSLNISAQQFADPHLAEHIQRLTAGLSATAIALELTESDFMRDPEQAVTITRALRKAGFTLAIDDFGTGYSSLAYLRRFSAQALKIDMSFVRHMLANHHDRTIVETIIAMAQALGMKTVAEGVETAEQVAALAEMGCDEAQGYHFGRPLPAEAFAAQWLEQALDDAQEPT